MAFVSWKTQNLWKTGGYPYDSKLQICVFVSGNCGQENDDKPCRGMGYVHPKKKKPYNVCYMAVSMAIEY